MDDPRDHRTRRRILAGFGVICSAGLAGCGSSTGTGTPAPPRFERVDATSVHVDGSLDLTAPSAVSTVTTRANARVLVLPGDASFDEERVADWLADGKILALFGPAAEATWIGWARSDAVSEHFQTEGISDADPDPQLVVAAAVDLSLPTFRTTWGDQPASRDVWVAIDDALVDIRDRRESA